MKQREENTLLDESYSNFESKWVLRIDLNKTELLVNDVTMETISSIMTATYNEKVSFCHSDMNSDNSSNSVILKVKIEPDECDDVISDLKALEQEIMNMVISGIQGINNVVVDLDMSGEGETWESKLRLALVGDGEERRLHTSDGEQPKTDSDTPRVSCPAEGSGVESAEITGEDTASEDTAT